MVQATDPRRKDRAADDWQSDWLSQQVKTAASRLFKVCPHGSSAVAVVLDSAGEEAARRSFAQRFATRLAVLETQTSRRAHPSHGQRSAKPRPAPSQPVRPLFAPSSRSSAAAVVQGVKQSPAVAITTPRSKQQPDRDRETHSVDAWQLSPRQPLRSESSRDRRAPITRISVQPQFTHDRSLPAPPPIPLPSPPATPQRRRPATPSPSRRFKRKLHIEKVYVPVAALLLEESIA